MVDQVQKETQSATVSDQCQTLNSISQVYTFQITGTSNVNKISKVEFLSEFQRVKGI